MPEINDIATLTMNPTIDTSTVAEEVSPDIKIRCESPRHEPGGGGINVSRAIEILGGRTTAVYPIGGATGRMADGMIDSEAILERHIRIKNLTRQNFSVREQKGNRQFRFGMPGPHLDEDEWEECLDELVSLAPSPKFIVASGSLPPGVPDNFYARVAKLGKKLGARVAVDTSGEPLKQAVREGMYLIKPNIRELSHILGREVDASQVEEACEEVFRDSETKIVVCSLGEDGAYVRSSDFTGKIAAPDVKARSAIGAGDSMMAGIILSMSRSEDIKKATHYGVAAGAAAVMTPGSELCRKDDTDCLFEQLWHS